jgi:hypothetical protein
MKSRVVILVLGGVLGLSPAFAQESKHEEHKDAKPEPAKKAAPAKTDAMKCCEGMDKTGGTKDAMKAKMEKMPAMKEKMAEKMKAKQVKNGEKKGEAAKDEHGH